MRGVEMHSMLFCNLPYSESYEMTLTDGFDTELGQGRIWYNVNSATYRQQCVGIEIDVE